jgi:hypothetical protein
MRAHLRVLLTAAALAAVATLGLAASAHATPPPNDERNLHHQTATTDRPTRAFSCNAGHGPQVDCQDPGPFASNPPSPGPGNPAPTGTGRLDLVRSVALLSLLAALTSSGIWLRRHHRPREAT